MSEKMTEEEAQERFDELIEEFLSEAEAVPCEIDVFLAALRHAAVRIRDRAEAG